MYTSKLITFSTTGKNTSLFEKKRFVSIFVYSLYCIINKVHNKYFVWDSQVYTGSN